ncbi:PQQ-dependent sugar dehydrogenase [Aquipuribacter hungaricus]|uniref:PQQ-dependent sugar dehydrogenase n=1 Tax=Aquipuribacter hungaricus TaxID=545624 RepID=A0ABV7WCN3_9MICO
MTATRTHLGAAALVAGALVISTMSVSAPAGAASPRVKPKPAAADLPVPPDSAFDKVTIDRTPGEPIDLAVLPDNRVLHVTRSGEVRLHDPVTGITSLAAQVPVYLHDEEGLQSIAVDEDFEENGWVYMYYSPLLDTPSDNPATPGNEGDAPENGTAADFEPFEGYLQLSRFQMVGDTIDLTTEEEILQVPTTRGICCHVGGDVVFDSEGNLYLSTGDDSNPFQSQGYIPIDERPERNPAFDAQRTSANTNDLRGKILRITPSEGGGYTIPEGNLFAPGTELTKPEIYVMGLRNPFRIELDRETDRLFIGDYSPDARNPDPARGPAGIGRWMSVEDPANYGWPYCYSPTIGYVDYDFATGTSGEPFDCGNPVNESPNNTGLVDLPEITEPEVKYEFALSPEFPELETGGIGPMAGPVYHGDIAKGRAATQGRPSVAWPASFADKPFFYEWTRDYTKMFTLDAAGDEVTEIDNVLDSLVMDNPIDMEFGPDGALYVLEYGDGYFAQNPDAQLSRFDYVGHGARANHSPVPSLVTDTTTGDSPLTVAFDASATTDPDGDRLRYAWDFDSDGTVDSTEVSPTFTYATDGRYRATLKVTDVGGRDRGRSASSYVDIAVGGQAPVVTFVTPADGQAFSFGDSVTYQVTVTDDEPVDCNRLQVYYVVGHDQHGHPISSTSGCTGTITTSLPEGHEPDEVSAVFVASYTDAGAEGIPAQTGTAQVRLVPAP